MTHRPLLELIASIVLLTTMTVGLVLAVNGPVNPGVLIVGLLLAVGSLVLRYTQRRQGKRADERVT